MKDKGIMSCCGFGNRQIFEDIRNNVYQTVNEMVERGCRIFYTGAMGDFDRLFVDAVRQAKHNCFDIKLLCVMPYMTNSINKNKDYLYSVYDDIIIPTELMGIHYKSAIKKRNQWIIDQSDTVIIYSLRTFGGAYDAMKYAEKTGKTILQILK